MSRLLTPALSSIGEAREMQSRLLTRAALFGLCLPHFVIRTLSPALFSLGHQRQVIGDVPAQVAGQDSGLDEGQLRQPQILLKQWMCQLLLLPFLIGLNHEFAPLVSKLERAALPKLK